MWRGRRQDRGRAACAEKGNGIRQGTVRGGRGGHVRCSLCRNRRHSPRTSLLGMKAAQPLWETLWPFLTTLKLEWPRGPAGPLLGLHPKEWKAGSCTFTFTGAPFTIANKRKPPKRPWTDVAYQYRRTGFRVVFCCFFFGRAESSLLLRLGFSLVAASRGCSLVKIRGLSCPAACGIFLEQGLNLCPLHCKANS